ncbi:hypothetical protein JMJ77_0001384 [Colletotrichum scovillei]|uniref:Uncharacterized protein n=1 Tax=Colletotrichum scovillei TaxID=1209932 RepID=A0A9P7RB52_9PEZI|nr:hypothetical protein JMJ77_0001384 [Colletotrichum scovillei]KAG7072610.1 hypothetical protein JMJ76_0005457 [Colletotrichum scovillei]KAG7080885.1 hypothetical protein JMJ78_0007968 [Colletotrichum scovillei]
MGWDWQEIRQLFRGSPDVPSRPLLLTILLGRPRRQLVCWHIVRPWRTITALAVDLQSQVSTNCVLDAAISGCVWFSSCLALLISRVSSSSFA